MPFPYPPGGNFLPSSYLDILGNQAPPAPREFAPRTEEFFWKNALKPKWLVPDFPKLGRMGLSAAGMVSGVTPLMDLGSEIGAAATVLSGGEDPYTKPPAAKPQNTKVNPVPAHASPGAVQQPGPTKEPASNAPTGDEGPWTEGNFPSQRAAAGADATIIIPPTPPPSVAPPEAPGQVKITLPDGRSFDYGAGESIPLEQQGTFGKGTFAQQHQVTREFGGTGRPGGFGQAVTPESEIAGLKHKVARKQQEDALAGRFPELEAEAAAKERVQVAAANAAKAVDRERHLARGAAEQKAAQRNNAYEAWRQNEERKVTGWETYAEKSGKPEDAAKAEKLRAIFEREAQARKEALNRDLAASGALSGVSGLNALFDNK